MPIYANIGYFPHTTKTTTFRLGCWTWNLELIGSGWGSDSSTDFKKKDAPGGGSGTAGWAEPVVKSEWASNSAWLEKAAATEMMGSAIVASKLGRSAPMFHGKCGVDVTLLDPLLLIREGKAINPGVASGLHSSQRYSTDLRTCCLSVVCSSVCLSVAADSSGRRIVEFRPEEARSAARFSLACSIRTGGRWMPGLLRAVMTVNLTSAGRCSAKARQAAKDNTDGAQLRNNWIHGNRFRTSWWRSGGWRCAD